MIQGTSGPGRAPPGAEGSLPQPDAAVDTLVSTRDLVLVVLPRDRERAVAPHSDARRVLLAGGVGVHHEAPGIVDGEVRATLFARCHAVHRDLREQRVAVGVEAA